MRTISKLVDYSPQGKAERAEAQAKVESDSVSPSAQEFDTILKAAKPYMDQYLNECDSSTSLVCHAIPPQQLHDLLDLNLPEEGKGIQGLEESLEKIFKFSIKTWSPRFMDKLFTGADAVGCLGELIGALLNTNCHVYSVSPVFTLMEKKIMQELAILSGWPSGGGALCPGGSYSNLLAIFTARNHFFPEIAHAGFMPTTTSSGEKPAESPYRYRHHRGPLVLFTSLHSHYSILKSGIIAGIGHAHIRTIPTDVDGKMNSAILAAEIAKSLKNDERPFFVNATAGTTVLGAFDPFVEIAEICKNFGLWMHVDGSWGGATIFHPQQGKELLRGLHGADSFTMNPHKVLGVPLLCSAMILKQPRLLEKNRVSASYLFHQVPNEAELDENPSYDIGAGLLGCGRRPNIVKMYLSWQYYGRAMFEERVRQSFERAKFFMDLMKEQSVDGKQTTFEFVMPSKNQEFFNICFWAYPPISGKARTALLKHTNNLDGKSHIAIYRHLKNDHFKLFHILMENITKSMHFHLHSRGKFMVDYSPVELPDPEDASGYRMIKLPAFWRLVVHHPRLTCTILKELHDELVEIGNEIDIAEFIPQTME